ncbi:aluminum resistance putative divalent cation transporter [Scheffersomyces coipomensis]|uniref:aluminum resistance putative divalent cation transporter n=1 Tax=Scheffersomyces coipomensis TaxID=1788519 RepID=UPI00315C5F63
MSDCDSYHSQDIHHVHEDHHRDDHHHSHHDSHAHDDDDHDSQNLNDHRHQRSNFTEPEPQPQQEDSAISDSGDEDSQPQEQQPQSPRRIEKQKTSSSGSSSSRKHSKHSTSFNSPMRPIIMTEAPSGSGPISGLRKEFYLNSDNDDNDYGLQIPLPSSNRRRSRSRSRSRSFSDQIKHFVTNNKDDPLITDNLESDLVSPMIKIKTNDSGFSDVYRRGDRRASRSSIDSEDSHGSRTSQETEEDVCFPMSREHIRINGIDFDEIEEFIKDEREQQELMRKQQILNAQRTATRISANSTGTNLNKSSSSALKYTPRNILRKTNTVLTKFRTRLTTTPNDEEAELDSLASLHSGHNNGQPPAFTGINQTNTTTHTDSQSDQVKFGGTRITDGSAVGIERFSFFSSESEETVHAPDIPSLVEPGQSVRELFRNGEGTWWLDCGCPTDSEMKVLAKAFGIHPLTAEDIRMQEAREKVELFRNYYFVCFHTFEPDKESEDYLEPINVYLVVFREGILTFHFSPISHPANVRRRVRQLRDYVDVTADWLCYALIDDITDSFAPVITGIEYEADAIEDSVFVARELDFGGMLMRIGESRRKVMTLMRLLSGKADVIKMFAKRCQDEAHNQSMAIGTDGQPLPQSEPHLHHPSNTNLHSAGYSSSGNGTPTAQVLGGGVSFGPAPGATAANLGPTNQWQFQQSNRTQPRADIALYLGDIQDHVVTMFQNLLAYEKIFSRSHANYLAQLQVESVNSNNKVTEMLSTVTLIGTLLVPLNVITGLFGMNVTVPGEQTGSLNWFFGIVAVMVAIVLVCFWGAKVYLDRLMKSETRPKPQSSRRSIKSLGLRRNRDSGKSIISFPNKYD